MSRLLLTGATGFVGRRLLPALKKNHRVHLLLRRSNVAILDDSSETFEGVDFDALGDLGPFLDEIDILVHCAGRAHIMKEFSSNPLESFRKTNTRGTLELARQAAEHGIRRFVFLSSVKAQGESTLLGQPFTESQVCNPVDPYGLSKYEAEIGLLDIARRTGMEVTIIRPPLVFGPGVKANFRSLIKALIKGLPLPLGSILENRRSMVGLTNLIAFVELCCTHPAAANQVFYVSDGLDYSTTRLVLLIAEALGRSPRLLPVPPTFLRAMLLAIGKGAEADRLLGSLQVSDQKARELLGWTPPATTEAELFLTVHS
jgi:UDP-4-keto-D-QuiNAc 4-reductase